MKVNKFLIPTIICFLMVNIVPVNVLAKSIDEIKQEEADVQKNTESISKEINQALTEVNEKYAALENLKLDIATAEKKLVDTEAEIEATQERIVKRTDALAGRMQGMQVDSRQQSTLQILLDSDSVTDFIGRIYAVTVLQKAEKRKLEDLFADRDKLEEMKQSVEETKKDLITKHENLESETAILNDKLVDLEKKLDENKDLLNELSAARLAEQQKIDEENIKKEKEAQAAKEVASQKVTEEKQTVSDNTKSNPTLDTANENANPIVETPKESGSSLSGEGVRQLDVQATAYSREEGGYITAVGINLYENPWVVAVDPSVIPLWSTVEVPGYGIAVAGDTGGAIKGNIIDLHMNTIAECTSWGRRNVTISVRN